MPRSAARAVELLRAYVAQVGEGDDRRDAVAMIGDLATIADRYSHDRQAAPIEPVKAKTALMVVSRTPGAHASVDRGAATTVPAIVEVTPGKHGVHVEAGGFVAEDVDGIAIDGQVVPVEVALKELPATLKIAAASGATISIDGHVVGTSSPARADRGRGPVATSSRSPPAVISRSSARSSPHAARRWRSTRRRSSAPASAPRRT